MKSYRSADANAMTEMSNAFLAKISGKDIAIALDGMARNVVSHRHKVK